MTAMREAALPYLLRYCHSVPGEGEEHSFIYGVFRQSVSRPFKLPGMKRQSFAKASQVWCEEIITYSMRWIFYPYVELLEKGQQHC